MVKSSADGSIITLNFAPSEPKAAAVGTDVSDGLHCPRYVGSVRHGD